MVEAPEGSVATLHHIHTPQGRQIMKPNFDMAARHTTVTEEAAGRVKLMRVEEVAELYQVSRSTVDLMPHEILPFVDFAPTPTRQLKRYHPLDVLAAQARLRAWREKVEQNQGEQYLLSLRDELVARDAHWIELARRVGAAA
jgi:hypothetical protein